MGALSSLLQLHGPRSQGRALRWSLGASHLCEPSASP
ncbi:unnamed protein product [Gulo gulo]|uniref:Uncharacterized protein n=1 Tax=Gulo gulo TaxID=48420 RepID=A0A9X9M121_GULGU|nr:unnamed protein product [Gulo gulo]